MLAKSASAATAALGVIGYALPLIGVEVYAARPVLALIVAIGMTAIVLSGLRRSNTVNFAIVSITLSALCIFTAASFMSPPAAPQPASPAEPKAFLYACALMFVAFTGYGRIATLGEEVRDPKRTIPKAIIITLVICASVYCLVAAAGLRAVGLSHAGEANTGPLDMAAAALAMPGLTVIIAAGAVTAMLGVLLNLILGLSRVALAMGRRNDLPGALARISPAGNPNMAVIFVGIIIAALALIGDFETIWAFSALTVLCYYAITNIAALRQPACERLYPRIISVTGLMGCLGLAAFIPGKVWLAGLGMLAIGFVLRAVLKKHFI